MMHIIRTHYSPHHMGYEIDGDDTIHIAVIEGPRYGEFTVERFIFEMGSPGPHGSEVVASRAEADRLAIEMLTGGQPHHTSRRILPPAGTPDTTHAEQETS